MDLDEAIIQAQGHLDMASDIIARIHDVVGHGRDYDDKWTMHLSTAGVASCEAIDELTYLMEAMEAAEWEIVPVHAEKIDPEPDDLDEWMAWVERNPVIVDEVNNPDTSGWNPGGVW